MINKMPSKKIEFGEKDENFISQLAKDIGCYYSKVNPRTYSLSKFTSAARGETGIFAWVHKEENNYFWVSTRRTWIETARNRAGAGVNGVNSAETSCLPRFSRHADDSVSFDTRDNYQKTVSSLRLIKIIR